MMKKILSYLSFVACLTTFAGCSTTNKEEEATPSNPKNLFEEGISEITEGKYQTAVSSFETLEKEHPASDLAAEAQVRRAYAQYLDGKFDDAIMTADDFIKQYPVHDSIAYMYYLKGLCYYDQIVDTGRDQQLTTKAIEALNELIARYPETSYARDAKLKVEFAYNNLAGKEMEIADYYLQKKHLIAALARYKSIIEQYQTSIFAPEALYRLVEIFYTLGDEDQAKKYAAVLGYNYPHSEWYEKAYAIMVEKSYGEQRPWYHGLKNVW
jgi:outer membrane protein assembly factor BamD